MYWNDESEADKTFKTLCKVRPCLSRSSSCVRVSCIYVLDIYIQLFGNTALHNAAFNGHKEICDLLLQKGADMTIQNKVSTVCRCRWCWSCCVLHDGGGTD